MAPKKAPVNVYTATKTTLNGLRGLGCKTVDYIWACRDKNQLIDPEKINQRCIPLLDFTVPDDYLANASSISGEVSIAQESNKNSPTTDTRKITPKTHLIHLPKALPIGFQI